jgi:hypothetical protein
MDQGVVPPSRAYRLGCALAASAVLAGCAPQSLLLRGVADQLAFQGAAAEDDLVLAREASAFYLKLAESVLIRTPGHLPLAASVAGGYTQYAYAFVEFEAERIEPADAKAARALRERAARLYARAHRHAMAALAQASPGLTESLALAPAALPAQTCRLAAEQVGVAYWAAASWVPPSRCPRTSPMSWPICRRRSGWRTWPGPATRTSATVRWPP